MLRRVYGTRYPTYKDCTISEDWHNFQNFAFDIEALMREKGIDSLDGYEIDKDIKSKDVKIYSKETVSLVTQKENNKERIDRIYNTVYIAENLTTGEILEFTNQAQFARDHGFNINSISLVLNGKAWSTGGFTFYKKGDKPRINPYIVYVAENVKTGETVEFTNQSQFAREHGLNPSHISAVLNGKRKSTGGWTFRRKE